MKKFMLLDKGPATPPGASQEKWPTWFRKVGDSLVDIGSPINRGFVLRADGSQDDAAGKPNGYSIIQARNLNALRSLGKDHPFPSFGKSEYRLEIFELKR